MSQENIPEQIVEKLSMYQEITSEEIFIEDESNGQDNENDAANDIEILLQQVEQLLENEGTKSSVSHKDDGDKSFDFVLNNRDQPYFSPSEIAIRDKLSDGEDEDGTETDVYSLDRTVDEQCNCTDRHFRQLNTSISSKDSNESELTFYDHLKYVDHGFYKTDDKAIREHLEGESEDLTVNDFYSTCDSACSDLAESSCCSLKLCKCTEKEMCTPCFGKYVQEFTTSIESSQRYPSKENLRQEIPSAGGKEPLDV